MEFKLASSSDFVVFNSAVVELSKVVADQRQKKPDAEVCYHNIKVDMTDPRTFTLSVSHRVAFFPKQEEDKDVNVGNIGKKESIQTWTAGSLILLWVVRWSAKGLMCVKPQLHLRGTLCLPPGRACDCTKAAGQE